MQRLWLFMIFIFCFSGVYSDTVLKLYRPFGEVSEQIVPKVLRQIEGVCEGQSHLILREDAFRCEAQGKIFDPCFASLATDRKTLICPQSPWVEDSVQIKVSKPLINDQHQPLDMSRVFPWALELMNGTQCQAVESETFYDSLPVRYLCQKSEELVGQIQRCKPDWSILKKGSEGLRSVEIKKAWF